MNKHPLLTDVRRDKSISSIENVNESAMICEEVISDDGDFIMKFNSVY